MVAAERRRVTHLLEEIGRGNPQATEELFPIAYEELRRLARSRMARERPGHTLQTTALVHEAYLRLVGEEVPWESRAHFYAAAAEAMRRILIDRARRVARPKHGGDLRRVELGEESQRSGLDSAELLALDQALARLEAKDATMAEVVKLRFFAGLTGEETAKALGMTRRNVQRLWALARAWLHREMSP